VKNRSNTTVKRKISFIIHSLSIGGAERVVANLSRYWAEIMGWEVSVLTLTDASSDFYTLSPKVERIALGVAAQSGSLFQAIRANIRRITMLRSILRRLAPDVTIGVMSYSNVLAILSSIGLPHRVIASEHIHPPMLPLGAVWSRLRYLTYPRADYVAALTEETARWIEINCPGSKVTVIPNPVPWPLDSYEPQLRPDDVVLSSKKVLLAMGRLAPQKGFDLLLDAFSSLSDRFPEWDLVIAGEGPEHPGLEAQRAALRLNDRVHLPGRIGNAADWYERADLYVMSSRFEGFGLTLAEAMSYECPVVSFDCPSGPADIITQGIDGLLVPISQGSEGLANSMATLMMDEVRRNILGKRGTEARERFSLSSITVIWERLFNDVCKH
jgi:glycosyltransferase involved in cell wall biosynthesis